MNVVIAAGGTAGHVNPAIALARGLGTDDISFIGTSSGLEATVVPAAGFELDAIAVAGFDRSKPGRLPAVGAKALRSIVTARRILAARAADVVVGMGGYVSLPVVLAARSRGIPVVLHEQNIVLGLAHRVSRPFARAIGISFQDTAEKAGPRAVLTGNPVLPELAGLDRASLRPAAYESLGLDPSRRTILVFGGSLGARTLNVAAPALAARWTARADLQVVHLSGRSPETQAGAAVSLPNYHRIAYTEDMAHVYAVADLCICRAGATTVAELGVVGLPSVLVPYPHHRDRQQQLHAGVLARAGAAVVVDDDRALPERLAQEVEALVDSARLAEMAAAARATGRPDAAGKLAALVRQAAV